MSLHTCKKFGYCYCHRTLSLAAAGTSGAATARSMSAVPAAIVAPEAMLGQLAYAVSILYGQAWRATDSKKTHAARHALDLPDMAHAQRSCTTFQTSLSET